jgi:predicted ArsR family transcriptional regulator
LAEAVDINPISVRHHVNKLEAEGLIQSEEERHGVGRPRLVYSLTNQGMEQFPQRYLQLTLRLLQQLKINLSEKVMGEIFQELAEGIAGELTQDVDLEDLTLQERLQLLQEVLTSEGFTVNLQEEEDNFYIVEASCPYHHVGEDYPEICVVDRELIAHFVSTTPQRIECILDGDKQCKYLIKKNG